MLILGPKGLKRLRLCSVGECGAYNLFYMVEKCKHRLFTITKRLETLRKMQDSACHQRSKKKNLSL